MAKVKYEILMCVGNPLDYSWELFDTVHHWKDVRPYALAGAHIYRNGERIDNSKFVDHDAVAEAYHDLALDEIVNLDVYCEDSSIADERRKSAKDTLKLNKLTADETWRNKINSRYTESLRRDPLEEPLYKRNVQFIALYNAETRKLVKVVNGKVDSDELPF